MASSVTYSMGYKRSLPNYENVTPFFSITRDVGEGETEQEVLNDIVATVEARLEAKIREIDADAGR